MEVIWNVTQVIPCPFETEPLTKLGTFREEEKHIFDRVCSDIIYK